MSPDPDVSRDEVIVCALTPWYYRRMGLMAAMFLGMGLYFCYDGKFGYPKENVIAEKKVWFEKEVMAGYDVAKNQGDAELEVWMQNARKNGLINKPELKQPRWDDFAAPFGWPSEPKMHSSNEIEQQYYWGGAMLLGAVVSGFLVLINHNKTFVGKAEQMVMPNGKLVNYADAFRVDKRKWDKKGLAHVYYRADGTEHHAVIDDLKFDGAGRVLDRLLAQFSGELIEKVADDQPETEPKTETSTQGEA
ncbi:hypothetical protein BH11VER1_BH11VER1_23240 [soil metagenome]